MLRDGVHAYAHKRVLLLQGPVGPFFARLARELTDAGANVFKVNFNGGDALFYPRRAIAYRGALDAWPRFLDRLLVELEIDVVLLFGDCRPVHRTVSALADPRGIDVGVFEEGYVRPDYVTFERSGVNGRSLIPRSQVFYRHVEIARAPRARPVGNTFWHAALWATLYYVAAHVARPFFRDLHHRPLTIAEMLPWLRAAFRKRYYSIRERAIAKSLTGELAKRFFLVPLQVHGDSQVHVHSRFPSVVAFIEEVVASFAAHAPTDTVLAIKHHPLDRGYNDYAAEITASARVHRVQDRVVYIHDQHLPTLLAHARGAVVINSTVGLSAIHHRLPTKALGAAIYEMPGLTYVGSLDAFWQASAHVTVDAELYARFRSHLINETQLNGSFYRQLHTGTATGLIWPAGAQAPAERAVAPTAAPRRRTVRPLRHALGARGWSCARMRPIGRRGESTPVHR